MRHLLPFIISIFLLPLVFAGNSPLKKPAKQPNYMGRLVKTIKPDRFVYYKTVENKKLRMDIFEPVGAPETSRPCFLAIHGGGWTSGGPGSMYAYCQWAARQGMVSVSIQYRRYKTDPGVTVFDCVKDARSAVRYLREHAEELHIDPNKIVTCGASAGGHLATATAQFRNINDSKDNPAVSAEPNAVIMLSPVIDTSTEGYGNAKIGNRWKELSPAHCVVPGLPPMLTLHGTADTTTPYKGARKFHEAMLREKNDSTLITQEGAIHCYMFKDEALYKKSLSEIAVFLKKQNFIRD